MKTENLAVDVVLIPENRILDLSIDINKKLIERTGDSSIVLGKSACLPHISLAMAGIPSSRTEGIMQELSEAVAGLLPYNAKFRDFASIETSPGFYVSGMDIVRDEKLMEIQERIAGVIKNYRCEEILPENFSGDTSEITRFSTEYSGSYLEKQTGENFSPHITLGHGDVRELGGIPDDPGSFTCNRLAICHLGNHCTCSGILESIKVL